MGRTLVDPKYLSDTSLLKARVSVQTPSQPTIVETKEPTEESTVNIPVPVPSVTLPGFGAEQNDAPPQRRSRTKRGSIRIATDENTVQEIAARETPEDESQQDSPNRRRTRRRSTDSGLDFF